MRNVEPNSSRRSKEGYRGDRNVLDKVAKNVSSLLGIALDPARQIILTPGTQAGLFGALASLIDPGDEVLLFDPDCSEQMASGVFGFAMHEISGCGRMLSRASLMCSIASSEK
jgi:DNA-binding transcriptional MocR family regulator